MAFVVPVVIGATALSGAFGFYKYMKSGKQTPVSATTESVDEALKLSVMPMEVIVPTDAPIKAFSLLVQSLPVTLKEEIETFDRKKLKKQQFTPLMTEMANFKKASLKHVFSTPLSTKRVHPLQKELDNYRHRKHIRRPMDH